MNKRSIRRTTLDSARKVRNDEWYTRSCEIQQELECYNLADKRVLLNCDSKGSNFFKYLHENFNLYGIKELIAIGIDFDGKGQINCSNGKEITTTTIPQEDGLFQSDFSKSYLSKADVVITNPPFSKIREWFDVVYKQYNKDFIVLAPMTAVGYKQIYPFIKDNKVWLGDRKLNRDMYFHISDEDKEYYKKEFKEGSKYKIIDGEIMGRSGSVCWLTSLKHSNKTILPKLKGKFADREYLKCDNRNAINVNKVVEIPIDYDGEMAVPLTFIEYLKPNSEYNYNITGFRKGDDGKDLRVNGKDLFTRILCKKGKIL